MTLTIGIDPRIRARRIAVRRAEGRRRLRFLGVVAALLALAVAGWAISRSPVLDLDNVRVGGVGAGLQLAVAETIGVEHGTPLVDLDLGRIEADLEALPWVESATAARDWPGTLVLDIVERIPVATLAGADGPVLVDATGVVIAPAPAAVDLPFVSVESGVGLGEVEAAALPGLVTVAAMPADVVEWVDAVTIADRAGADDAAHVGLELVGAATVDFGVVDHLDDKFAALRAFLGSADLSCVRHIDVSVADLTTVRRNPICDGRIVVDGAPASDS